MMATPPSPPPTDTSLRVGELLADADRCVRCGLCLTHCPTYRATRDEGESPRGRIALAQALLGGQLPPTAALTRHIDRCLACRACEAVCPAQVPYGRLLDGVRAELRRRQPSGWIRRRLQDVVAKGFVDRPAWLRAAMAALRAWQGSALEGPSRRVLAASADGLARLLRYLPALSAPAGWARVYPAHGAARAEVALFLGCVARELDVRTITAAIRVLARLGYTVRVPAGQGCCGAIYLHDGEEAAALEQVRRNLRAFAESPKGPIVSVTSGCAATLAEYAHLPGLEPGLRQAAAEFSARVYEVTDLVARAPWPESVRLVPLGARVAVHEPCSARNVLRCARAPYEVLGRIPGIGLVPLPGNEFCCGAAGSYMVTQPQMADRLREGKLNSMAATGAATVVTVNLGCALHLSAGRLHGSPMPEVVHPLVLLDRQVTDSPPLVPAGSQFMDTDTP